MRLRLFFLALTTLLVTACGGPDNSTAGDPAPTLSAEAPQQLNLLVIGGTSGVGLETVKLALNRGHLVTAMARHPEKMTLTHANLSLFKGDAADPEAVDAALAGHDAVVFTIGMGPTRDPVTVFSRGTSNVLASMNRQGISRLVMVTGIGAGDSRGHGSLIYDHFVQPVLLNTVYQDKDRSEILIGQSDSDWVIVRPGFLDDGASERRYRVIRDMEGITAGDISRADVAHFLLVALEEEDYWQETVLLSN